ncbi:ketoacyl-synthetase C-terminal extension domain-containing protein, partial [Actinophytocola xanthii]
VAGIIKMVQALRYGVAPRTLHVDEPSSHVDWDSGAVSLLTEAVEWPALDRPRRAAVSSFGISGTNVHVILEQDTPEPVPATPRAVSPRVLPWVLSARTAEALDAQTERIARCSADPLDVAFSLVTTRSVFEHRAVLVDG